MVTLRATRKLRRLLPLSTEEAAASDTALGDWYANRLVFDRRPLLLLVCARSLLAILTPAREVRALPKRLSALVAGRLKRLGIADRLIDAEVAAMEPVRVGPTVDRSVVGSMVEFGNAVSSYLPIDAWDETTFPFVESRLATIPCRVTGRLADTIYPGRDTRARLQERWGLKYR